MSPTLTVRGGMEFRTTWIESSSDSRGRPSCCVAEFSELWATPVLKRVY